VLPKQEFEMKIVLIALALLLSMSAQATFMNGNELLSHCESEGVFEDGVCNGYIIGVVDSHNATMLLTRNKPIFCLPGDTTEGQTRKVFLKYLNKRPADRHYDASGLVLAGLKDAYPCK
jgi:hypothetical protein